MRWGPALEDLGLGEAVVVEGPPQRLLARAQLAGGPVDADLVGKRQGLRGGRLVLEEPGALRHRGPPAQAHPLAGGGAGEDAGVVVAGLGAV